MKYRSVGILGLIFHHYTNTPIYKYAVTSFATALFLGIFYLCFIAYSVFYQS